jgi:thioesterase domain-containing protein
MIFEDLLDEIQEKGIEITVNNGELNYSGPDQYITEVFLQRLKDNKAELIKYYWPLKDSNLVLLNPAGNRIPLIIVHADRANLFFKDLLDPDQPLYGYLHPGSEGEPVKFRTVEEFADEYVRQLQIAVPKGPVFLGGFSFGGIIAFEMACKLIQMGYEVLTLILIDCINPTYKRKHIIKLNYYNRLRNYLLSPDYPSLNSQIKLLITKSYIFLRRPVPLHRRNFYILANYTRAASRYNPELFTGKVLLFRAGTNICKDHYLGWNENVNGNIEVIDFEGDHLSIVDEYESTKLLSDQILQKMKEAVNSFKDQTLKDLKK